MTDKSAIRARADAALAAFKAAGASVIEADILQPGATLLDLYGEDIRARAYVVHDPVRGEMMLRPDFTIPMMRAHATSDLDTARYTYSGEVFRVPEDGTDRPAEYIQVGFERVGPTDAATADAEVFARLIEALSPMELAPVTGDMGLLRAAVLGLRTSDARKAALLRHLWRPGRFRRLLDRFSEPVTVSTRAPGTAADIGKRRRPEIEARVAALHAESAEAPLSATEVALIDDLMDLRETASNALSQLQNFAVDVEGLTSAVNAFEARLDALAKSGVDVDTLPFEASYGRTTLEYYDGFVFGIYAQGRPDLPPIALGGRYDGLAATLTDGATRQAVGGVIRPGILVEAEGGQ